MIRLTLTAILVLAAAPALAQTANAPAQPAPAQPAPPAASGQPASAADNPIPPAAMAFGQCVSSGAQSVPASVTPEDGATAVLGGCATQRQQLEQAVETVIASLPEEQKTAARTQLQTRLAQTQTDLVGAIRQQRAAAAQPQAPAAPSQ